MEQEKYPTLYHGTLDNLPHTPDVNVPYQRQLVHMFLAYQPPAF